MASKKERSRLAAQAWMAQAETDWRQEQARQYKSPECADIHADAEMDRRWHDQAQNVCDLLTHIFHALAGLAFLFALQALALAVLIWRVWRP